MKRLLMVATAALLVATTLSAQIAGKIGLYADAAGTDCNIVDDGGLVEVHMLHVMTDGAIACEFKLDASATGWIPLGDNWDFQLVLGSSADGAAIAYGACFDGSIHLGVATFLGSSAPACTEILVVPSPRSSTGKIQAISCTEVRLYPSGGVAVANADHTCQCTVPVSDTTWGKIKELYR